jgi:hypothetical protein
VILWSFDGWSAVVFKKSPPARAAWATGQLGNPPFFFIIIYIYLFIFSRKKKNYFNFNDVRTSSNLIRSVETHRKKGWGPSVLFELEKIEEK